MWQGGGVRGVWCLVGEGWQLRAREGACPFSPPLQQGAIALGLCIGRHDHESMRPHLRTACAWASSCGHAGGCCCGCCCGDPQYSNMETSTPSHAWICMALHISFVVSPLDLPPSLTPHLAPPCLGLSPQLCVRGSRAACRCRGLKTLCRGRRRAARSSRLSSRNSGAELVSEQ